MDTVRVLTAEQARAAAATLEAAAVAHDGHPSLGEAVRRDLESPAPTSKTFVVGAADEPAALLHVAPSDTFAPRHFAAGLAVRPDAREETDVGALLDAGADHVAHQGGGDMVVWRFEPTTADDAAMRAAGFERERDLLQMRVALPLTVTATLPRGYTLRTFEPGRDERAWLDVNNRAFENHPEQGAWIESTLARRMAEPWFDPDLFLLASDADGLAGFNWLKIHEANDRGERIGEIFVIGVDPRTQGSGLGRALAVLGLERIAACGISTAMLYVAAENEAARRLYESLGFRRHRVDRAYRRRVAAR